MPKTEWAFLGKILGSVILVAIVLRFYFDWKDKRNASLTATNQGADEAHTSWTDGGLV